MNRSQCEALVKQTLNKANELYHIHLDNIPVEFYSRGTVAGKAYYSPIFKLQFHSGLMEQNSDNFENTIIHEVAHLVTKTVYPKAKQAHGPEFKSVMQALGGEPNTYHNYQTVSFRNRCKQYAYQCSCREHYVSALANNAIQHKGVTYRCHSCGTELVSLNRWKFKG